MRKIGKTRIKLADLLSAKLSEILANEIVINPSDFWIQEGYYRSCDVARWGGHTNHPNSAYVSFYSWDRMTECIKNGVKIQRHREDTWNTFEVHAKEIGEV